MWPFRDDDDRALKQIIGTLEVMSVILHSIAARQETIMAAIDDLNAAVTALTTAITAGIAQINSELQTILNSVNDGPAIEAAVANINTVTQNINDAVTSAQGQLGGPTPPKTP